MSVKSLKKNIIINITRILLQFIFPIISFPYTSRVLLPEGTGKVNFTGSIVSYFVLFASFGVTNYGIRTAAKLRDDKKGLSKFVYEILILNSITLIISYLCFFFVVFFTQSLYEYRALLFVQSFTIFFTVIGIEWLYIAEEDYSYITLRSFVFQLLSLICLFIFVKNKNDYLKYALISIIASGGSNLLNFIHARKYLCRICLFELNLKQHIKPVFIFFLHNVACSIYYMLDTTMLGFLKGDEAVGLYSAAIKVTRLVLSFVQGIGAVLMPRLSYYYEKDKEAFVQLLKKGFAIVLLLSIPFALGLCLLSDEILLLFSGRNYISASLAMKILTLLIPIVGLSNMYAGQIFMVTGKELNCVIASAFAAIVNLVINFILIPHFSYVGAAIASVLAEFIALVICILYGRKIIQTRNIISYFIKPFIASLPIIFIYIVVHNIFNNYFTIILITVFVSVIIFSALLLILQDGFFIEQLNIIKKRIKSVQKN